MSSGSASQRAEVYNTDRFAELFNASRAPGIDNLGLAARFLMRTLRENHVPFAFLGGWAVFLRGGGRTTQDVDVAVGTTMENLKSLLMQHERISVPERHGETCIQIFIHTGGRWERRHQNVPALAVSVDVIINGNLGTPPALPAGSQEILPIPRTAHGDSRVPVIDIFWQFSSKLGAHNQRREGLTNDYQDLVYLLQSSYQAIYARRHEFDLEQRIVFCNDVSENEAPETAAWTMGMLGLDEVGL